LYPLGGTGEAPDRAAGHEASGNETMSFDQFLDWLATDEGTTIGLLAFGGVAILGLIFWAAWRRL
jgi:hypothetical protein